MPIQVLICDDSKVARKQLARSLPQDWNINVTFASNGADALAAIKTGQGEILFLDLNMPGLDGYDVLQAIRNEDLPTMAIVVSGDLQPEARRRAKDLGALGFVPKPADQGEISEILKKFGVHKMLASPTLNIAISPDIWDGFKEVANVAMGQAANLLARLLDVFVEMPIPTVKMTNPDILIGDIRKFAHDDVISTISQGFIGSRIAGEALVIFNDVSVDNDTEPANQQDNINKDVQLEQLAEIASVVTGACLKGIADQLDIRFSQSYPMMLGYRIDANELLSRVTIRWETALAIEMGCVIQSRRIACNILLLFTEDSIAPFSERTSYLFI